MIFRTLTLTGLGAVGLALSACAGEPAQAPEAEQTASDELALSKRLAFMAGHVEAGIALYRAGEAQAGGPHLLHPVTEAYAEEREGLDAIGFDPVPYEAVSQALEAGRPADEIEPQLKAVALNLAEMRAEIGGQSDAVITYLMEMVAEEYAIAVTDGTVSDPGEYQDAWGFARVARQIAEDEDAPNASAVRGELDALIALWPEGAPIPPEEPSSIADVQARAADVIAALSGSVS